MCTGRVCSYQANVRLSNGRNIRVARICPELAKELAEIEESKGTPAGIAEGYDNENRYVQFFWKEVVEVLPELQGRETVRAVC